MGAPSAAARLKREDHHRTKHDSSFSKWKILIGPSDWEDHWLNKEGAARYRVQNLPAVPGPGVYEIGVAIWDRDTGSGRDVGKMDPARIVVVYLGQAENVRSRLQRYGRGGAHLDMGISWAEELNASLNGSGPGSVGLFKEIFARGLPIVYRWALMSSKKEAEKTEAMLLARFDYAWNKVANVMKRPTDALLKIDEVSSRTTSSTPRGVLEIIRSLTEEKAVGVPIKGADTESNKMSLFARVLKFGRSQPIMVVPLEDDDTSSSSSSVCGVRLGDGSICNNEAVEGRKRCPEHKGKKKFGGDGIDMNSSPSKQNVDEVVDGEFFVPICGVILANGSPCTTKPLLGNKRCEDHKGKRSQKLSPPKMSYPNIRVDDNCCGVALSCGSYCKRLPVKGRKRCEEHKGMRLYGYLSPKSST